MATRKRKLVEPGNCGICGVTLGTPHAGNCPLGAPPVPPGESGVNAVSPPPSDAPLFVIDDIDATESGTAPVVINGTGYQWARWGNFSLRQRREMAKVVEEMQRIEALTDLTDADDKTYTDCIERLLDISVPGLSADHRAALSMRQREDIGAAFLVAYGLDAGRRREMRKGLVMALNGNTSSPPSSASTATAAGMSG